MPTWVIWYAIWMAFWATVTAFGLGFFVFRRKAEIVEVEKIVYRDRFVPQQVPLNPFAQQQAVAENMDLLQFLQRQQPAQFPSNPLGTILGALGGIGGAGR